MARNPYGDKCLGGYRQNCGGNLGQNKPYCDSHWAMLPYSIRNAITAAAEKGTKTVEGLKATSDALDAAMDWFKANPKKSG